MKRKSQKRNNKGSKGKEKGSQSCSKPEKLDHKPWMPQPKQIKMIELLIDLDDRRNKEEKCKEVGISRRTLYNWFQDANFVAYMNNRLELSTDAELVDMWRSLKSVAKRGNVQALRTYFELKGKLRNQMEVTGKDGGPIETQGNVEIVFNMPRPPGKREADPEEGEDNG
jgi:hypothetical protein